MMMIIDFRIKLILLISLILQSPTFLNSTPIFERITVNNGLSHNKVVRIYEDSKGFLWFCTENGLNRYDGHKFKVFKFSHENPNSLSNNIVIDILEDNQGIFWIATYGGGLNRWNPVTNKFKRYLNNPDNKNSISSNFVLTVYEDRNGNIWLGTEGGGINKFNRTNETFKRYLHDPNNKNSLSHNTVRAIHEDDNGILWIGTDGGGVNKLDRVTHQFKKILNSGDNKFSVSHNYVISIVEDDDNLWFATYGGGLNKFQKSTSEFTHYRYSKVDDNSISDNVLQKICKSPTDPNILWIALSTGGIEKFNISLEQFTHFKSDPCNSRGLPTNHTFCIFEDRSGLVWVGTDGEGVAKYNRFQERIEHYSHSSNKYPLISSNHIFAIFEDKAGYIWIGTNGGGLNKLDRRANSISYFTSDANIPNGLVSNVVSSIVEDKTGNLWIGTTNGLNRYNVKDDIFSRYKSDSTKENSLSNNSVFTLMVSSCGDLWISTIGGGLNRVSKSDIEHNIIKFRHYLHNPKNPNSISSNSISCLFEDHEGFIWVGTVSEGLNKLDNGTSSFSHYKYNPDVDNCLSNNFVTSIYQDRKNMFWIGTHGGGVNKFNPATGRFIHINENSGLANNTVLGILEDNNDNLWISTLNGISNLKNIYQDKSIIITNYYKYHGFQDNQYSFNAYHKLDSGELSFGGINGFNIFRPDQIRRSTDIQKLVISDFKIFNKSVELDTNILYKNQIILPYTNNFFSFEFAILDYRYPSLNKYAFYLEGLENNWNYVENLNYAYYTNISPGNYKFRIKASNSEGIWTIEGKSIDIIILPPWWRTNLAYTLYIILVILCILSIWQIRLNRIKLQHNIEIEKLNVEKMKEIDESKSRFFASISHEFRTPLTLIEGPVKQILQGEFQGNIKEVYNLILKNTRRLLDLINQLLDLSKLEAKRLKLQAGKQNILPLLCGLVQSFESLARQRGIDFIFNNLKTDIKLYIDAEKFERILINLLANAFKFTPDEGRITVDVSEKNIKETDDLSGGKFLQINIINSGSYLTPEQIEHIFDRFYQVNESSLDHLEGTGIGLSLVKELVELHHGQIKVRSEPVTGTAFIVTLPFGKDHLNPDEIIDIPATISGRIPEVAEVSAGLEEKPESIVLKTSTQNEILIVEDNRDVRTYVAGLINDEYVIIEAENGKHALQIARKKNPDLIISDVMMPGMDGMEFCRILKEDIRISHIPVIMLTARADLEDKLEGLELGADDYIAKPFEPKELRLRIRNVLKQRERLRNRFADEYSIKPSDVAVTSVDELFLRKLMDILEHEMYRPEFTVEEIAGSMHMSRATLNRKLKALTNLSPAIFLRVFRMKRAKQLLQSGFGNLSQVALEVGYNSLGHFTQSYIRQFGQRPSDDLKSVTV